MKSLRSIRRRNRREDGGRLPAGAWVASATVHAVVLGAALLVGATSPPTLVARTYQVRLVAAADEQAPERLRPQPAEVEEEEHRPPPPSPPEEEPAPQTEKPTVVEETPPPRPVEKPPARGEETGEEPVNVQLDGAVFAFPEYLDNIIRQVLRYWRSPSDGRSLRAELVFTIHEDGSVSDIEWRQRSGDGRFDLMAKGAIESAGRDRAFGPLPERYPRDRLRVSFFFDPSTL